MNSLMENMNSPGMLDEWRNYLRKANTNIFEIINKAISVAASDHPVEFQTKKDIIAGMLFSFSRETLDETKTVSKVLKVKHIRHHPETEDETNIIESIPNVTGGTKVCSKGVDEVLRIKDIMEKGGTQESVICDCLAKLQDMGLSINTLDTTGVGKTVRALEKHASKEVSHIAKTLIQRWKAMVNEYWINKESSVVKPVFEKGNPTNLESKLNIEKANLSKDSATPNQQSKDREVLIVQDKLEASKRKLVIEEEIVVKKQSSVVKSNKPPTGSITTGSQNPTKSTIPRKLEEQKLEATKRKLREGYERADDKKRQRQTQVIEMHDLLRKDLAPKYKDNKFGKSSLGRLAGNIR